MILGNLEAIFSEAEAIQVRDKVVSSVDEPGLMKLTIITLKAVLEALRLDNAGRTKGELVRRLLTLRATVSSAFACEMCT
jgi:hypothetical protein